MTAIQPKDYTKLTEAFKKNFVVIDQAALFRAATDDVLYADPLLQKPDFAEAMSSYKCFEEIDFLYIDIDNQEFFISKENGYLLILKLKEKLIYNKVLLEIQSSEFLSSL